MGELRVRYTAQGGGYQSILALVSFVALIELGLAGVLIVALVHAPLLRLLLGGGILACTLAGLAAAASPLWGAHRLTPTHLRLRFGWLLRADVPRDAIAGAAPVDGRAASRTLGATYDAVTRQAGATLAPQGQLRLQLSAPVLVRVNLFQVGPCERILINVDNPAELLAALAQGTTTGAGELGSNAEPRPLPPASCLQSPASCPSPPASQGSVMIRAAGLTRRYGAFTAVDQIELAIRAGEIYGLLGLNGAGKTTTLKLLVGLLEPTAGSVQLAGHDLWAAPMAARQALGYVGDRSALYERLSGREFLDLLAQVRGLPLADARRRGANLLDRLELGAHADRPCGAYSLGMRRKLALAGALLHQPAALILDEPLNGLDPRSARQLKDLLMELAAGGTAVLLSTHDLATAEALCQRVGILHQGRMIEEGSPAALRAAATQPDLESLFLSLV